MSNNSTSASGGYLTGSQVPGQAALEDVFHDLIAGITGLPGDMVRPRWQREPGNTPALADNWCAFGVISYELKNFPEIKHHAEEEGHDEVIATDQITLLTSFFGPAGVDLALGLRDGIHLPQNRFSLRPNGLAFTKILSLQNVPEIMGTGWRRRTDLHLSFVRETRRKFAVLNLLDASADLRNSAA
jgi:hypothetical protein